MLFEDVQQNTSWGGDDEPWSEAENLENGCEHIRGTSNVHVRHFWHGKLVIEELMN